MIRNLLSAERYSFKQLKIFQNLKIILCTNSTQNGNNKYPKHGIPLYANFSVKRFASSDAGLTNNILKKVLFINAESPDIEISDSVNFTSISSEFENLSIASRNISSISENITNSVDGTVADISYIPPPPVPVDVLNPPLNILGEQTFESLGMGGWYPTGIVQNALEFVHVTYDIPWWGTIMCATMLIRVAVFPLVIKSQIIAHKFSHVMPMIADMQKQVAEAKASGNNLEASRIMYEMQQFVNKNMSYFKKMFLLPLIQAPIFITMFWSLRACTELPVESFTTGGTLWFTDLTVMDPYYILPLITSTTLLITMKVGTDGIKMPENNNTTKHILTALPFIMFPFIMHFPSAILCYWVSTNVFSLGQVSILKIPSVRNYFGILQEAKYSNMQKSEKGFISELKESYSNTKMAVEIESRHQIDQIASEKAGSKPTLQTLKRNPEKKKPIIDVKIKLKE